MNNKQKMKIVIIVGATCSGKDTLARKLINEFGYKMVVSTTSRPMRNGEIEGREYYFITKEKGREMLEKDMFIEHREYEVQNGDVWIYGITKDQFDSDKHVAIVDFNGMKSLLEYFKDKDVDIATIYVEACVYTRMLRYASRDKKDDETMYECCRRILSDKDEVEIAKPNCDMIINTDDGYDINNIEKKIEAVFDIKKYCRSIQYVFWCINMKIYTSYYNNLKNIPIGLIPIGVSLKTPSFALKRIKTFKKLFPDENIFEDYKSGIISEDDFRKEYEFKLSKLDKKQIIRELFDISNGADIVLMCWEKDGFCHRHIIAKWLSIGRFKVEEL